MVEPVEASSVTVNHVYILETSEHLYTLKPV